MTAPADPLAVAGRVADALERLGVRSTIGGSIAASFAGEPRSTIDIDMVAALDESHITGLVDALSDDFYVEPESVRHAVRTRGCVNLIHHATQYKVDVQARRVRPVDYFGGTGRWRLKRAVDVSRSDRMDFVDAAVHGAGRRGTP